RSGGASGWGAGYQAPRQCHARDHRHRSAWPPRARVPGRDSRRHPAEVVARAAGLAEHCCARGDVERAATCAAPGAATPTDRTSARTRLRVAPVIRTLEPTADADCAAARGTDGTNRARPRDHPAGDFTAFTYLSWRS